MNMQRKMPKEGSELVHHILTIKNQNIVCLIRLSDFYDNHRFMLFAFRAAGTEESGKDNKILCCALIKRESVENLLVMSRKETIE